ncbi:MAG: hypothetical protein A2X64_00400 [Ignavibacteria bacterium GWF2_33_9]|nr:MAG: hypothetical protein A2X64_00400 [Ignavibacteria bacterium GWF2_33_9]
MKNEYNFTKGVRGKFYTPDAKFKIPIYLDDDIQEILIKLSEKKKENLNDLINKAIKANLEFYKVFL